MTATLTSLYFLGFVGFVATLVFGYAVLVLIFMHRPPRSPEGF